jgi:hypothetical protein
LKSTLIKSVLSLRSRSLIDSFAMNLF